MERRRSPLNSRDRLFLERAVELAERGCGNTSPNPPVGAVVVRDGVIAGEGYHHQAGAAHAEVEAIRQAGDATRGATLYVSLEPCNHFGKTPPCSQAVTAAGFSRVVIGAEDPNPKTARGGIETLRAAGIPVDVADFAPARALIEPFAAAIRGTGRPYAALKMAVSTDGFITSQPSTQQWLTGREAADFVRDLRIGFDAVAVGAGTVRVDDPQLTVRPAHLRLRPYTRVVICESGPVPAASRVFASHEGYAKTIVLAPGAKAAAFGELARVAEVVPVGDTEALDLRLAMQALRERGITSVLCEGGPTIAGRLTALGLIDRIYWLIAPKILGGPHAVPAFNFPPSATMPSIALDRVERVGDDLLLGAAVKHV